MNITFQEAMLPTVARQILKTFEEVNVWIFNGEMGVGKTTLIKAICKELGVLDEVSSPTFSIINQYLTRSDRLIYHFDFYRIEKIEEMMEIGAEEYFSLDDLCLIEWPNVALEWLPDKYLTINIDLIDHNTRNLTTTLYEPF